MARRRRGRRRGRRLSRSYKLSRGGIRLQLWQKDIVRLFLLV